MPYDIQNTQSGLILELTGGVTARHVGDLGKAIASSLTTAAPVIVQTKALEDIDTSVLQLLVSLRKTAPAFTLAGASEAFVNAAERAGLRRELLSALKESA